MQIKGIESMTSHELAREVANGGKFVIYQYAISVVILSFKQGTDIHFVRSTENAVMKGLPYTLLTLVAGWWVIPFGPIFSAMALFNNLKEHPQRAARSGDCRDCGGIVKAASAKAVAISGSSSLTRFSLFRQLPSLPCAASRLAANL